MLIYVYEYNYLVKRAPANDADICPSEKGTDVTSVVVGCLFLTPLRHMHCKKRVVRNDERL